MLGNRTCRAGFAGVRYRAVRLLAFGLALFLGMTLRQDAQAQKAEGQDKPLPAKSSPTSFYTPEGQEQIADAILTDAVDQLLDQADEHYHKGEYNHLINISRVVVQGNPHRVEAFANAAYLLWSTGQNDAATAFLKQGIEGNPDNYYMYDEMGAHFYHRLKDYPNAVAYYEKAVKFDCPFFTWSGLAHSYEKVDQWEKAVGAWEKAANFVTRGGNANPGKSDPSELRADQVIGDTMRHNLNRARAELAKRRKQ